MLTGWLLYSKADVEQNKSYIDWFIQEAWSQNIKLSLILREDLSIGIQENIQKIHYQNKHIQLPDFAVVRTIEPLLNKMLEAAEIHVFNNSEVSRICNNKALTHYHINKLGVPMADTFFAKHNNHTPPAITYPFVVKQVAGRGGKHVYFINNKQEWNSCIHSIPSGEIIIQSVKHVQLGKDVRVFVVGKKIIGAVLRQSQSDFRSNYKLGGTASWYPLNEHETVIIERIIHAFDFGMAGIDFLVKKDGSLLFNEIEDVVGSRTLSAVSDINILKAYVAHIKTNLRKN